MNIWYKLAILCGLTPLVLGVSILVAWLNTCASWLEAAGIINIAVGSILFLCGLLFLVFYVRSKSTLRKPVGKKSLIIPLLILFLNFPAALISLLIASSEYAASTITINNYSKYEIKDFTVKQLGEDVYFLPLIKVEERQTEKLHFQVESDVRYSLTLNGNNEEGILFGYVTPSVGSHADVTVSEDGVVTIEEKF